MGPKNSSPTKPSPAPPPLSQAPPPFPTLPTRSIIGYVYSLACLNVASSFTP
ncbi:hypothetical protein BaRGS_00029083, partial [Batillaria attramentaria]